MSPIVLLFDNIKTEVTGKLHFSKLGNARGKYKGKIIPVIGRGGPKVYETSRLPYFLDNQLKDGGEIFSIMPDSLYPKEAS
jgi:hypothetical protein